MSCLLGLLSSRLSQHPQNQNTAVLVQTDEISNITQKVTVASRGETTKFEFCRYCQSSGTQTFWACEGLEFAACRLDRGLGF